MGQDENDGWHAWNGTMLLMFSFRSITLLYYYFDTLELKRFKTFNDTRDAKLRAASDGRMGMGQGEQGKGNHPLPRAAFRQVRF